MKDSDKLAKHVVKFTQLAAKTQWDMAALQHFFKKSLAPRLKDELACVDKAPTMAGLKTQVLRIDTRYWHREAEKSRENCMSQPPKQDSKKPKENSSSNSSTNTSNNSSYKTPSTSTSKPANSDKKKKPYANLLGSNGKLTDSEKEHRCREGLCGFCGNKHKLEDCNKRKKANEACGKASTTQSSTSSGADADQSKK
jgi:hypothetical protein